MRAADADCVDVIKELRLRKWAREHYVRPEQRGRRWHPIVLEEMSCRDAELAELETVQQLVFSPYVPLVPTESYYFDEPHAAVPVPKLLTVASPAEYAPRKVTS